MDTALNPDERNANESARLDPHGAHELARERYGITAQVSPLPSYADQNFRLENAAGERYVLKVSRAGQAGEELELENAALGHLAQSPVPAPRVVLDSEGHGLSRLGNRWVRLITWIDGTPLAELQDPPAGLLRELGQHLATLDLALGSFDHPAAHRHLGWDLVHAQETQALIPSLTDPSRRARVAGILEHFEREARPKLERAPRGVIHNDANDWNVLVTEAPHTIAGILDFGDMVHTALVCEPAIAMAYAMLPPKDPLAAGCALLAGYVGVRSLESVEVELLLDLVETRLAVSVIHSAHERAQHPDNEYLSVTEPHAWRLLDWLAEQPRAQLEARFEETCLESSP